MLLNTDIYHYVSTNLRNQEGLEKKIGKFGGICDLKLCGNKDG